MDISHHGPDVPGRVWRLARLGRELDRVEVVGHWWVEVDRVSFVEGVNLSSSWDLDLRSNRKSMTVNSWVSFMTYVRMSEDEFTKAGIECESVYTLSRREDQVR